MANIGAMAKIQSAFSTGGRRKDYASGGRTYVPGSPNAIRRSTGNAFQGYTERLQCVSAVADSAKDHWDCMNGFFLLAVCVIFCVAPVAAQEGFRSGGKPQSDEKFNAVAPPEDLHKYLSPDGRFIDHCRYWKDHPDPDTLRYGQPDHFAPGRAMGETRSFNGQSAPYARCAMDPCPPNGTICWRNPGGGQSRPPLNAQIEALLREKSCTADNTGAIFCPEGQMNRPGAVPTLSGRMAKTKCRVTGAGIACDTGGPGTPDEKFAAHDLPQPPGDQFAGDTSKLKPPNYDKDKIPSAVIIQRLPPIQLAESTDPCKSRGGLNSFTRSTQKFYAYSGCIIKSDGRIWCPPDTVKACYEEPHLIVGGLAYSGLRVSSFCTVDCDPPPGTLNPVRLAPELDKTCKGPPARNGRFGVANINDADPDLLVTAKILQGWDDCAHENMFANLVLLPVSYVVDKVRGLKTIALIFGYGSSTANLIQDINALRSPGQSLGDAAYLVGKLLCQGYDLKSILARVPKLRPKGATETGVAPPPSKPAPKAAPETDGVHPPPKLDPKVSPIGRGMTLLDDLALRSFAATKNLMLVIRDSNIYAGRWIGNPKAVPKPESLKVKTLKPPENLAALTPARRAEEAKLEPFYGLVSARGLSAAERKAIENKEEFGKKLYKILDPCDGEVITTIDGKYIYSDIDIHGVYDLKGHQVDGEIVGELLHGTTTERFFMHGGQDEFALRNDPKGGSFGPQPPVTVYMPSGQLVHLDTMAQMKSFYTAHGIPWEAIYPLPLGTYQAVSGKP